MSIFENRKFFFRKMSTFINKHIVITKRYNVVTSTPMKLTKPSDQSTFLEWPSPLDQRSNESRSPYSPTKKPHETAEPLEQKKSSEKPETADKICPVDHAPESCEERDDFVANTADSGVRSPKFKQLIIMDSDEEEEFWKNRNSDSNKKRKYRKRKINQSTTQPDVRTKKAKELDLVRSAPNLEEEDSESTSNDSKITHNNIGNKPIEEKLMRVVTLPESLNEKEPSKNLLEGSKELDRNHPKVATSLQSLNKEQKETEPPRSSLKRSKTLEENASPEDSDAPNKPVRRLKNLKQIDHNKVEYVVRRSNRKRCKPLEFWNGERQEVERDFTSGIQKHTKPRKNVSESQVQDTEKVVGIEQGEVATDVQTLTNKNVGRKQSILKKQKKSGPKASVKFSPAIETEKPATEKTEKIGKISESHLLYSKP